MERPLCSNIRSKPRLRPWMPVTAAVIAPWWRPSLRDLPNSLKIFCGPFCNSHTTPFYWRGLARLRCCRRHPWPLLVSQENVHKPFGMATHSVLSLEAPASAAIGLILIAAGHASGWPILCGGAHALTDALARYFKDLSGSFEINHEVTQLPGADLI